MLAHVDKVLARHVAEDLGLTVPTRPEGPLNRSVPADGDPKDYQPRRAKPAVEASAALSMAKTVKDTAKTRKVAILAADGVDGRPCPRCSGSWPGRAPCPRWWRPGSER